MKTITRFLKFIFLSALVASCRSAGPNGGMGSKQIQSSNSFDAQCANIDFLGRHTIFYRYASISSPGVVNDENISEWHVHTKRGCFFWGLGVWYKPEENKRGCVNWVYFLRRNGNQDTLVGMFKDIENERFLGYGEFDLKSGKGLAWDRYKDQKLEDVSIRPCKDDCDKIYSSCKLALEG